MKKIAVDSYYYSDVDCYTVGIIFNDWTDYEPTNIIDCHTKNFERYIPGQFYKRELPGILALIKQIDLSEFDTIIIDGYVWLNGNDNKLHEGLGKKLYNALYKFNPNITVVGIAKTLFGSSGRYLEVHRGHSKQPLYITYQTPNNKCLDDIYSCVKHMKGKYRIPKLLKILDKETKKYKDEPIEYKDKKEFLKKRSWKH